MFYYKGVGGSWQGRGALPARGNFAACGTGRPSRAHHTWWPRGDGKRTTAQFCRRGRTPAGLRETERSYNQDRSPHPPRIRSAPSPKGEGFWAADSRPYRTYKRLSGEYRRGRSQTGPPSMGKFPGYGGRGTPQGGLSRPSADSPSAPPLRVSRKPSVFA